LSKYLVIILINTFTILESLKMGNILYLLALMIFQYLKTYFKVIDKLINKIYKIDFFFFFSSFFIECTSNIDNICLDIKEFELCNTD
jgi:hypothetical protein